MGTRSNWSRRADRLSFAAACPAVALALLATGCTGGAGSRAPSPSARAAGGPAWVAVDLPASGTGRPVVRDVAACPGRWYAAGGYATGDGSTRPALWTSVDARTWSAVPVAPESPYGPVQLLISVACGSGATVAAVAIGSTSGGVHGNARVSNWAAAPGGALTEQAAPFELFGGPDAIGVGRLATTLPGAPGYLIVGAWRDANGQAGAAVWVSADGTGFRLVNADPELESDARGPTEAHDGVAGPGGFTVVGSVGTPGSRVAARDPAVWTSTDGLTWRRAPVPADVAENEEPQRVLAGPGGDLVVGVRGNGFGAWRRSATGEDWRAAGRFGSFAGTGLPMVTGLATGPAGDAYAVVGDGARYRLWSSTDGTSWTQRQLPAAVPVGDQRTVAVAGGGGRLLIAAEDGVSSRLWVAG